MSIKERLHGKSVQIHPERRDNGNFAFSPDSNWVRKNLSGFSPEQTRNALLLLSKFTHGVQDTYQHFDPERKLKQPATRIVWGMHLLRPENNIYYDSLSRSIFIKRKYLKECSDYDMEARYVYTTKRKEVIFDGTFPDYFRLAGAEEGHHSIYISNIISPSSKEAGVKILLQSSREKGSYDAQVEEYEALKWQIQYAEMLQMPGRIIDIMKNQLNDAALIRKRLGLPL